MPFLRSETSKENCVSKLNLRTRERGYNHKSTYFSNNQHMTDLELKVLKKLTEIPKGKVVTYKTMANACNIINGARFIGNVMRKNPWPEKYPCYKVVKITGEIGAYSGGEGIKTKIELLKKDGIQIKDGKIVDLERYLFLL